VVALTGVMALLNAEASVLVCCGLSGVLAPALVGCRLGGALCCCFCSDCSQVY
jgi:hypothetical protein